MKKVLQDYMSNFACLDSNVVTMGLVMALAAGIFCAVIGYTLQINVELLRHMGVSGLFVPDSLALKGAANVYWDNTPVLDGTWTSLHGVMRCYWVGILYGSWAVCGVNVFLILVSAYYFIKTMESFIDDDESLLRIYSLVMILVLGNLYLIEVMAFPNKEIPLMAITNAYMYYLAARRSWVAAALLSGMAFVFRDGYGLILLVCMCAILVLRNRPTKIRLASLGLLVAILAFIPIMHFMELGSVIYRNVALGSVSHEHANLSDFMSYFSRLKYNAISLSMLNS